MTHLRRAAQRYNVCHGSVAALRLYNAWQQSAVAYLKTV
jgi:hypothetical protein